MNKFGWHYPPGMSGHELDGLPPCAKCGHEDEDHGEEGYTAGESWPCLVEGCDCDGYQRYPDDDDGYDPDQNWVERHGG